MDHLPKIGMLGLLGSSARFTSTPSGICPMLAKPLFLGLFCPPKPFEDRVSLQGTWSAVIGRKALNLSWPKVKLCREATRDPSRDKPRTLRFVGSSILESGCCIAGRLVVAMLKMISPRKRLQFRCCYTIRSKIANSVRAWNSRQVVLVTCGSHKLFRCYATVHSRFSDSCYEMQIAIDNSLISLFRKA